MCMRLHQAIDKLEYYLGDEEANSEDILAVITELRIQHEHLRDVKIETEYTVRYIWHNDPTVDIDKVPENFLTEVRAIQNELIRQFS